jgi:hypothetical protein
MGSSELSPFERGGQHVPVVLVAPEPLRRSNTVDLDAQRTSPQRRRRAAAAALVVLMSAVLAGQWLLRPTEANWLEARVVVGLESPPTADAVHAFLQLGAVDVTATVSLGGRTVQVRGTSNRGRSTLWEQEISAGGVVGGVALVDNAADRRIILHMSSPRSLAGQGDRPDIVVALNLEDGRELVRREWDPAHVFVPSSDGRLYRLDGRSSELQAMEDLNAVRWRTRIDPYMWLAYQVELHAQGGWLLLVPDGGTRRTVFRGGDAFLTALDPSTGTPAGWLDDAAPGQRFQRLAMEDGFVEHSVGAGERVVRARDWGDGEPRWQRFEGGLIPITAGGDLYLTAATPAGTRLMKLDPTTGRTLWQHPLAGTLTQLLAAGEAVVAVLPDRDAMTVLDAATGDVIRGLPFTGPPFMGEGEYFVGGLDGAGRLTVTRRSLTDGATLWAETYPGFRTLSQSGDRLVLLDPDGRRVAPLYPS